MVLAMLCALAVPAVAVDEETETAELYELRVSGGTNMSKLSKGEIITLLRDNPNTLPAGDIYDVAPSRTAPYAPGKVKDSALETTVNRLNALRRLAGLPSVALDAGLCEEAQYGAVLIAASNFSHYPNQPSDMDDAFYNRAKAATSSSNIYSGGGLASRPDGFMNDSDGSNVDRLGHRRWQLNPVMGKIGFGYAGPTVEKVFDRSGAGCDYDFIGWPASGSFPSNLFGRSIAWSVTLNPQRYQTPNQSQLQVTLTRESDGKVWTFSGDSYKPSSSGLYFNVDTGGYGVSNCIIFRPDIGENYEGIFHVRIDGLKTRSGSAVTSFEYEVDFFDVNAPVYVGPFTDVLESAWYGDAIAWAYKNKVVNGISDTIFDPDGVLSRAQTAQVLYNIAGRPNVTPDGSLSDVDANAWFAKAITWAVNEGLMSARDGGFAPDSPCTRAEIVQALYNQAGKPDTSGMSNPFTDVDAGNDAIVWASNTGLVNGMGDGLFVPNGTLTRAQIVQVLYKQAQKTGI